MWPPAIRKYRSSSMIWNQFSPGNRAKSKCMAWQKLWNGLGGLGKGVFGHHSDRIVELWYRGA